MKKSTLVPKFSPIFSFWGIQSQNSKIYPQIFKNYPQMSICNRAKRIRTFLQSFLSRNRVYLRVEISFFYFITFQPLVIALLIC
jgi:hypothetical protein